MNKQEATREQPSRIEREAVAWLSVKLGNEPLVPCEIRDRGAPREIISAGRRRLAQLRAARATARTLGVNPRIEGETHNG